MAPAQAFVRAEERRAAEVIRSSEFGMRNWDAGISVSGDRSSGGTVALGSHPTFRFYHGFALSSCPAFRFYRCVLPLARVQGLRFCWGVLHSAHTRLSVSAAVLSLAHPVCVILPRCFALGTCPALRFWRNCLSSAHARPSVSDAALPSAHAQPSVSDASLPSAHAQHCGSGATACPRHASGACVSVGAFCLGSRLLFAA